MRQQQQQQQLQEHGARKICKLPVGKAKMAKADGVDGDVYDKQKKKEKERSHQARDPKQLRVDVALEVLSTR